MRRSGRTVRAVDAAIQLLFTYGGIIIPISKSAEIRGEKPYPFTSDHHTLETGDFRANTHFIDFIVRRLTVEHPNTFKSQMKYSNGYFIIELRKYEDTDYRGVDVEVTEIYEHKKIMGLLEKGEQYG